MFGPSSSCPFHYTIYTCVSIVHSRAKPGILSDKFKRRLQRPAKNPRLTLPAQHNQWGLFAFVCPGQKVKFVDEGRENRDEFSGLHRNGHWYSTTMTTLRRKVDDMGTRILTERPPPGSSSATERSEPLQQGDCGLYSELSVNESIRWAARAC